VIFSRRLDGIVWVFRNDGLALRYFENMSIFILAGILEGMDGNALKVRMAMGLTARIRLA